jgi:RHS repeat-associated protein
MHQVNQDSHDEIVSADALSSVTSLSNGTGALANTYSYDSYGRLTASSGTLANPFQYAGREFDQETTIYFDRARYYDQSLGRFISEDPIGFVGGQDFYVYVANSPKGKFGTGCNLGTWFLRRIQ